MSHGGRAPDEDRERESLARAEPVDELSDEQQSGTVGELEGGDDVAVSNFCPTELDLQHRLEQRDHLAVHVVHGGREEQQAADQPATVAGCELGIAFGNGLCWR